MSRDSSSKAIAKIANVHIPNSKIFFNEDSNKIELKINNEPYVVFDQKGFDIEKLEYRVNYKDILEGGILEVTDFCILGKLEKLDIFTLDIADDFELFKNIYVLKEDWKYCKYLKDLKSGSDFDTDHGYFWPDRSEEHTSELQSH